MRVLVISDIHSNWVALGSIRERFDVCLCLGDLVDYGVDPGPCVNWVMTHATHSVRGNHDHGVAQGVPVEGDVGFRYLTKVTRPLQWIGLGGDERRFLVRMPLTKRLVIDGKRYYLVHGSPRDPLDEYVMKDPAVWERRVAGIDADFVCVGHTHVQYRLQVGPVTVLNPGSVGLPRDGDPRLAYAIIEDGKIELKRQDYPVEEAISRISSSTLPDLAKLVLAQTLRSGKLENVSEDTLTVR